MKAAPPRAFTEVAATEQVEDGLSGVGPFRIGELVAGSFVILSVLGMGGMGIVYEARDIHLLRPVAIKAALFATNSHAIRAEAQALSAIRGAAFVNVHQFGVHEGVEFMVMERLFGETLERRLEEVRGAGRRLPIEEVLDLLIAITGALCAAHVAGIAQRDLKPSNVFLCEERVVLFDLGLSLPEVLVRADDDSAGSVEYVAPEVLLHEVHKGEGPLIDLYALGIIGFELLTNATPFFADSVGRMLANQVCAPIPEVSAMRSDVPVALAELITELLAKDPRGRPADAEAVLWRLQGVRDHALPRGHDGRHSPNG